MKKIFAVLLFGVFLQCLPAYAVKYLFSGEPSGTTYQTPVQVSETEGFDGSGSSFTSITMDAFANTSGNAIIVGTYNYDATSVDSVTDTAGNTYHYCGVSSGGNLEIWAAYNVASDTGQ